MINQLSSTKEYALAILTELLDEYAPSEKPYAELFLEKALQNEIKYGGDEEKLNIDTPTGIGSPDLFSTLLIPIIIEIVKGIVLPHFKDKLDADAPLQLKIKATIDKHVRRNSKKINPEKLAREIEVLVRKEFAKKNNA